MNEIQIQGLPTFKGTSVDKNGNVIAIFKGDVGVKQMQVVVGDVWRELEPGAQYIVEMRVYPTQMTIDEPENMSIDEIVTDESAIVPVG